MPKRRRLVGLFSLPLVLLVGLAATQVDALAQGFKAAGNYTTTGMLGSVFYGDPQTSFFIFASRQVTTGPSGTTDQTSISLNVTENFGDENINCFINDSSNEFNVAPDLSSATFHGTIPQNDPACGGNLPSDVQVDVTWTGAGPIQSTNNTTLFSCSGYTDETHGSDSNNAGPATFNVTGLAAPITTPDAQTFHFGSSREHAQGAVPPDACSGGVGRGAGRETPAAGNYFKTFEAANATFSASDGSASLFMFVGANTSSSNPVVGPSTTTAETDLVFNLSTFTGGTGGCFVIDPGDFTLGATSASLHTSLPANPPACGGGTGSISPAPFTIDVTWTGLSPVATTRSVSQYSCLNYHFQTSTVQVVDTVTDATVSMPGLSTTILNAGTIGSIDTRTHADGTPAAGCTFRG
jgi:hypothetical protein